MRELFEQFGSLRKDFFLKLQEALDDLFHVVPTSVEHERD